MSKSVYPYTFEPIYKEKIWGGRNLERLFGRNLPAGRNIGESWELADLPEGVSVVTNGPQAGKTLTQLTGELGADLLGGAGPCPGGRFPLLLKLLDANDTLSLQVHPDADAAAAIGSDATPKTECWYVIESRNGSICKGLIEGVGPEAFRSGVEADAIEDLVRRIDVRAGDFHYLPAGTVHALGAGVVVAEVQTPSDTTYRVTDWGRGRPIHVERSMQCIHFAPADDAAAGPDETGTLLVTEFFTLARRTLQPGASMTCPPGKCVSLMFLAAEMPIEITHAGPVEPATTVGAGDTVLLPAGGGRVTIGSAGECSWLMATLPEA